MRAEEQIGRPSSRWLALGALIALGALVAAACGGGDSAEDVEAITRGEREPVAAEAEERTAAEEARPAPAPALAAAPGVLRIAWSPPLTLDPALVISVDSARFVLEIFGGLLTLDQDLNLIADLAEAVPEPQFNADGSVTYRFALRRDALFHNERRVQAADVKGGLERAAAPETFSRTAPDFLNDIVGMQAFNRGLTDGIEGIQVIDERTIEITIDAPKPYFLFKLAHPVAFVVDLQQIDRDPTNWADRPNGTGPFRLVRWDPAEQIILEPFDRYHLGPAALEEVQIRFAGGGLTQYENDEVDIAVVSADDIERVRDPVDPLNAQFVTREELSTFYVGFNVKQPPFDDPLVRRAFAMAIDRDRIIEVVLQEVLSEAEGILPPGILGYDESFRGLPFDPERAQQLLEESTYAGRLPDVRLSISGAGATPGSVVEAIRQDWQDNLGIVVEIQQAETATFFSDLDLGLYQMFNLGWIADYPDPENFLDVLFRSGSLQNHTLFASPEVDALLAQARTEFDSAERARLYQEVQRILIDEAVWIPLFHGRSNEVVKPYVQGYIPPRMVVPHLRYITVSE